MKNEKQIRERIKYCKNRLANQERTDFVAQLENSEWETMVNTLEWVRSDKKK